MMSPRTDEKSRLAVSTTRACRLLSHAKKPFGGRSGFSVAILLALALMVLMGGGSVCDAANPTAQGPLKLSFNINNAGESMEITNTLKIVLLMTVLTVLPGILLSMTCFTRIIIVLSFVRKAMSFQTLPPTQILIGIALFLSFYVMAPVWTELNNNAIQPYLNDEITQSEAFTRSILPFHNFMLKHTGEKDIALFVHISKSERPKTPEEVPTHILIPAFVTSELKIAFQMGFLLYLPFLVIDMVVACVLTAMGMFMLPPVMISMPFKLVLFVLVDGWHLVIQSLVSSFF